MLEFDNNKMKSEEASKLLENVLNSCDITPSAKSLDEIMSASKQKKRPLFFYRFFTVAFLLVIILVPLAFLTVPELTLKKSTRDIAVTSHILYETRFIMTLAGDADYDNIYALKDDGTVVEPEEANSESGLVIIPYDGEELNIYVPSKNGGTMHALLKENKQPGN